MYIVSYKRDTPRSVARRHDVTLSRTETSLDVTSANAAVVSSRAHCAGERTLSGEGDLGLWSRFG